MYNASLLVSETCKSYSDGHFFFIQLYEENTHILKGLIMDED